LLNCYDYEEIPRFSTFLIILTVNSIFHILFQHSLQSFACMLTKLDVVPQSTTESTIICSIARAYSMGQIAGSRPSDHYFRSVCLSVCLFVCAEFFFSRLRSDSNQTRTHVTCPGLVVSPRI